MEAVRAFNNELSSLYEVRPPVSRAKMTHVTKCAIKAIKFYKHVVQSVEKFILKCKPEYKVPGLYVIDSIVRQSRHQFGQEKDVFAPRFTKNIVVTFQNLFKCPTDERSKLVRVLNLWQKNGVFPIDVIQPLMDLAADPTNTDLISAAQRAVDRVVPTPTKSSQQKAHTPVKPAEAVKAKPNPAMNSQASADSILTTQTDMLNTVNQLLQQTQQPQSLDEQQQQLHQLQILQQQLLEQTQMMQHPEDQGPVIDNTLLAQIQTLTNQLLSKTGDIKPPEPSFDKKLLDFDYGESDEEDDRKEDGAARNSSGPVQHLLTDPALMEHIQQMSQTIQKTEQLQNELNIQEQLRQQMLQQQQEEFDQQINQGPAMGQPPRMHPGPPQPVPTFPGMMEPPLPPDRSQDMETDDVIIIPDDGDYQRDRSHRGRDRSRSPKRRRRSRSRSRDRRKRSRSRERRRRSRSADREAREKERERWKKRLPPIKEKHLSVCSTTIWVGHLAKLTSEEELVRELENYGAVDSINMIPPRGCAFVCMNRRKDAAKAVEKMKGLKINGSAIKIAWAPGKGMKDLGFKDMWNVELGVTYVPWDKLPSDLALLIDGGMIDEDTIPDHLKELAAAMQRTETVAEEKQEPPSVNNNIPVPVGLPPGGPPSMPPGQPPFPQMPGLPPVSSIPVLPGQPVGLINPMLIPMPGQTLPNMPGPQVGMHPIMSLTQPRLPQVNAAGPIPLMSIPNQTSTTSAGSQLNAAIQNIMASSGGPTPATQGVPGMVRPGFNSPRPGMFQPGFNPPGFNPNVPPPRVPPPNFRLPPPSFSGEAGGPTLGDGDSTPEQDEGQATVTKVISNDWPSKFPNRDVEDRDRFPKAPNFGQPPGDVRMQLPHDQKLLHSPQTGGNRMPHPRGPPPGGPSPGGPPHPLFSQNSPMNANSPRPLLGPRMMQPERPDINGPNTRPFMLGPQGMVSINRPFGPGVMGNQMRLPGQGELNMGGPQPLMGNRFGIPRNQGQPLLGLRPGFPGSRMLGPPQQRFGNNNQLGGPRQQGFGGRPMDDRIRPLFGDSPNRPFDRPEFDRFGDRDRPGFHSRGNGPDDRPLMADRWGPLDGPPGIDRDMDHGERGGPFNRFERDEFRRDSDRTPDWRMNRRDGRNHRMPFDEDRASPEVGSRRSDMRNRLNDRDDHGKAHERSRDKDRGRRSRWSNLDPSQTEDVRDTLSESVDKMNDSVNMEDVSMNISSDLLVGDSETKTENAVAASTGGGESDLISKAQPVESTAGSVDADSEKKLGNTSEALADAEKASEGTTEGPQASSGQSSEPENVPQVLIPVAEPAVSDAPPPVKPVSIGSVLETESVAPSEPPSKQAETKPHPEGDPSHVKTTTSNGSTSHSQEDLCVDNSNSTDNVLNENRTEQESCPAKNVSPMEEGELEPGEVSS